MGSQYFSGVLYFFLPVIAELICGFRRLWCTADPRIWTDRSGTCSVALRWSFEDDIKSLMNWYAMMEAPDNDISIPSLPGSMDLVNMKRTLTMIMEPVTGAVRADATQVF